MTVFRHILRPTHVKLPRASGPATSHMAQRIATRVPMTEKRPFEGTFADDSGGGTDPRLLGLVEGEGREDIRKILPLSDL